MDTEQQQQCCFIHSFLHMSSLRELRCYLYSRSAGDMFTNLFKHSANSYRTCPVHVNKMTALKGMSVTSLQR